MKLADFGCCYVQDVEVEVPNEIIGTAGYIAPEVISVHSKNWSDFQKLQYSGACDVYSLGVLLYILLVGYPPYRGSDTREILMNTLYKLEHFITQEWFDRLQFCGVEFHQSECCKTGKANGGKRSYETNFITRCIDKFMAFVATKTSSTTIDAHSAVADEFSVYSARKPSIRQATMRN